MAARSSSAKGSSHARARGAAANDKLDQLREAIAELRTRIEDEARERGIKFPGFAQAARAPEQFIARLNALSKKGQELSSSLRRALSYPDSRRFREQARSMLDTMRIQIERRANELKDKGEQLDRLLRRSARQALQILQSSPKPSKRRSPRTAR
jgi:phage terminase Nu1 subunit (DNA packaging protein)